MRAREIVEVAEQKGWRPPSRTQTPAQSVNRDLHAAIRRGDVRVAPGPATGQFCAAGVSAGAAPARPEPEPEATAVDRLPVGPLADLVEARGGLRACGIRHRPGDTTDRSRWVERMLRGYLRSRTRGWTSLYDADELAVKALGLHPSQVWGDLWWSAIAAGVTAEADTLRSVS